MSKPASGPRSPRDIVAGALFVALGAGGLWLSLSYPMGTSFNMGPGYFPALIFGAMILVGAGVLVRGMLTPGEALEAANYRALALVIGSVLFFALTVRVLGFVASTSLSVMLSTYAAPGLRLYQRVSLAAGLTLFCWAVFLFGLGLVIPVWPEIAA